MRDIGEVEREESKGVARKEREELAKEQRRATTTAEWRSHQGEHAAAAAAAVAEVEEPAQVSWPLGCHCWGESCCRCCCWSYPLWALKHAINITLT